ITKRRKKKEATVSRPVLEDQKRVTVERVCVVGSVCVCCFVLVIYGGGHCCYLLITIVLLLCLLNAGMLPTKRELGKRSGRAGSSRTDNADAETDPQVDTGASSLSDDRGNSPVEATNEPTRESGSVPTCRPSTESAVRFQECLCGAVTGRNGPRRFYEQLGYDSKFRQRKCISLHYIQPDYQLPQRSFRMKPRNPRFFSCIGRITFSNCGKVTVTELKKATAEATINKRNITVLIDTGSF
ncbi:hypothetical protein T11_17373, partial [Trichinella zimbabwensis]